MKEFSGVKFCLIVLMLFFLLSGCGSKDRQFDEAIQEGVSLEATIREQIEEVTSQAADIEAMGISREIDAYIKNFTGLYTSNASDDTASAMVIEEQDFPSDTDHGASLTIYSDLSGKRLRYRLICYGETGNQVINYYLCESFVWISRQSNFYISRNKL